MNGILLVDKPADWTSHDVVAKLRGVLGERRMGHSGTLDPMATGLLVVFAGRATRAVSFSENHSKCYEARLRLGLTTDTQDTTGTVLSRCDRRVTRAELEAIAEVCCRRNVYVIADEIYCNLVYDNNEFVSFASLSEDAKNRTILVNGVSKSYAMTGWRIGYSASNPQLAKVMANYLSHSTSAPSTISQQAAITALTGPQEDMQVMKQAFEQRRDHLVERMNQIEGVSCIKPEGAFYVMMNMKGFLGKTMYGKVIESAEDFAQLFLEKGLVATVPCTAFAAPGFVRWSYATSLTEIDKGLDRLEAFIKNA